LLLRTVTQVTLLFARQLKMHSPSSPHYSQPSGRSSMARKQTDFTKLTRNANGKDEYRITTIGDLVVLYEHLSPEKRKLLLTDIVGGLEKGADAIAQAPAMLRPLLRASIRISPIKWIDDDKGRVTVSVKMREGDQEALFTKEL
jgi:hypothetical protein